MIRFSRFSKLTVRSYAAAPHDKATHSIGGDSRNEVIRRALFDAPLREKVEIDEDEQERIRVINNAWDLYVKERREEHQNILIAKYQRMVDASNALLKLDSKLFKATQIKNPTPLFPQQMKTPTLTPGNTIWNYNSQTRSDAQKKAALELKEKNKTLRKAAKPE